MAVMGKVHSMESFGTVDGPGIRFVLFLQGCPLRCIYCHNPDALSLDDGELKSSDEVFEYIMRFSGFIKSGGVTISGGEPLRQHDFCKDLLQKFKERRIHTAIDTSGIMPLQSVKDCIDLTDMLLLDIKAISPELCKKITGAGNENAIKTLEYCESTSKPVWIRHVVVQGYTLEKRELEKLADFLTQFKCVERTELLPFHKMGEYKWKELGLNYTLYDTPSPTDDEMAGARKIFADRGLSVR